MRAVALSVLAALAASACASAPPDAPALEASGPAPVAGQDWFLSEDGGTARLAYGAEASDDLKLALDCTSGSGKLEISALAAAPAETIHLGSGGDTERYAAASEPSMVGDGLLLTAKAASTDPVFQRFRRLGWLAQWRGQAREVYAPHPGSGERIGRFFALCG